MFCHCSFYTTSKELRHSIGSLILHSHCHIWSRYWNQVTSVATCQAIKYFTVLVSPLYKQLNIYWTREQERLSGWLYSLVIMVIIWDCGRVRFMFLYNEYLIIIPSEQLPNEKCIPSPTIHQDYRVAWWLRHFLAFKSLLLISQVEDLKVGRPTKCVLYLLDYWV